MKKLLLTMILLFAVFWLTSCWTKTQSDPNIDIQKVTTNWKKTYVWFVATWCPYCKAEVPVLDKFYRDFKDQVNMQLINTDQKKFSWDLIIPQDLSLPTTYEKTTWDKCEYVPSYVIYDENGKLEEKVCWWKLTYDELKAKLITNNTNDMKTIDTTYQTSWFKKDDIWVILTTSNWKIEIKLFPNETPKTVNNFLALAQTWYYNQTTFHRVIKDFMIQWWDPEGTWMWWESIYGKEFEDEFVDNLQNLTWSLSMANAWPNTNWSQFFINVANNSFLNWKHTVFGQVVNWYDNVEKISKSKTTSDDKPEKEIKIIWIEIVKFDWTSLKPYKFSLEDAQKEQNAKAELKKEADKNRIVKAWDIVEVNYIWKTTADNKEFDNSYSKWEPIEFEVWAWKMIPWFDTWVLWMKLWEKKTLNIKAKDAYGEYDPSKVQEIKKEELKQFEDAWYKLEVWTKLPTMYWEFEIKEVTKDNVKVDLNHFLVWKDLTFDIEIVWFKN